MGAGEIIAKQLTEARELEKAGRLSDASVIYQKLFKDDPNRQEVIDRLLIVYRKLKDHRKELVVLNDAIAAARLRQKATGQKWIQSHPQAASAGKSMLRQLEKGDDAIIGLGEDPIIERWIKRKDIVAGKVAGKKGKPQRRQIEAEKKHRPAKAAVAAAAARKTQIEDQRAKEEQRRTKEEQRKAKEEQRRAKEERRKVELERKKADAERKKVDMQRHPSLFVVILQYLVPLDEIDDAMKQHISYLNKHYANRDFLVSGRLVPRTGGLILVKAKNKSAVEKIIKQDPFLKRKLARAHIIEFSASQFGKGLEEWLKR